MKYAPSSADQAPFPSTYATESRYLKYREGDLCHAYAKYFQATTRPVQPHVVNALLGGMSPGEFGYELRDAANRIGRRGYESMETGWTRLPNNIIMVSVLTNMPNVTAPMWDWWFGWHGRESARYKLWFPDAHQYSALGEDRSADRSLTDKQRYIGNVSYVDEYIGGSLQRLAIRFFEPTKLGISETPGMTHICARVSLSTYPIAFGWLIHQVRPTEDGAEMRSRFFLNDPDVLALPARALPASFGAHALSTSIGRTGAKLVVGQIATRLLPRTIGADMIYHCASEMNHLAGFLPQLFAEFHDTP